MYKYGDRGTDRYLQFCQPSFSPCGGSRGISGNVQGLGGKTKGAARGKCKPIHGLIKGGGREAKMLVTMNVQS